ncbi:50S ribosomal protein L11 [Candidatus Woesearchaeota archaeon]|nr:50S ribosomal protein L11 [Candidatus Woesearchaeota archaeon]
MPKEKMDLIVEGGKASITPQMAQTLGPMKINMSEVIKNINERTSNFAGVKVPVKLTIDSGTKQVDIGVGSPPVSELVKKELNMEKGSGIPQKDIKGNISIEQVIKIADMKKESMYLDKLKPAVKNVIGSCNSLGVYVEGKRAKEAMKDIVKGVFDNEINGLKKEPSKEKLNLLKGQLKAIQEAYTQELERAKAEEEKAKAEAAAAVTVEGAAATPEKGKEEEKKSAEKKPGEKAPVKEVKKEEPKKEDKKGIKKK